MNPNYDLNDYKFPKVKKREWNKVRLNLFRFSPKAILYCLTFYRSSWSIHPSKGSTPPKPSLINFSTSLDKSKSTGSSKCSVDSTCSVFCLGNSKGTSIWSPNWYRLGVKIKRNPTSSDWLYNFFISGTFIKILYVWAFRTREALQSQTRYYQHLQC